MTFSARDYLCGAAFVAALFVVLLGFAYGSPGARWADASALQGFLGLQRPAVNGVAMTSEARRRGIGRDLRRPAGRDRGPARPSALGAVRTRADRAHQRLEPDAQGAARLPARDRRDRAGVHLTGGVPERPRDSRDVARDRPGRRDAAAAAPGRRRRRRTLRPQPLVLDRRTGLAFPERRRRRLPARDGLGARAARGHARGCRTLAGAHRPVARHGRQPPRRRRRRPPSDSQWHSAVPSRVAWWSRS